MTNVKGWAVAGWVACLANLASASPASAGDTSVQGAPPTAGRSVQESMNWTTTNYPRSWSPGDPAVTADPRSVAQPVAAPGWVAVAGDSAALGSGACAPPCAPPMASCDPCADPCPPNWAFGVFGHYTYMQPSGTTYITKGGVDGTATTVDLHDDLDTGGGNAWEVGVGVRYRRHRVHLSYEWMSFSGDRVLTEPLIFHAETYPLGEQVKSTLDLTFLKAGYDYAFVLTPKFSARAGLSAWLWDFDQRMKGIDSGIDSERSFSHVFPLLDLYGEYRFGWAHVGLRASGGGVASDRYIVDLEATVGARIGKSISIDVGYRWMQFDFHETTNLADMTFQGPSISISTVF
jgi:hypothetical protein